jgi:hypothetical protein
VNVSRTGLLGKAISADWWWPQFQLIQWTCVGVTETPAADGVAPKLSPARP